MVALSCVRAIGFIKWNAMRVRRPFQSTAFRTSSDLEGRRDGVISSSGLGERLEVVDNFQRIRCRVIAAVDLETSLRFLLALESKESLQPAHRCTNEAPNVGLIDTSPLFSAFLRMH